ncbi:MAG: anti-sigma factor domain-containing protein [Acidimicrobiales bacterium]
MTAEDEILELLGRALAAEPREPPPDRVAALRVLADDRRLRLGAPRRATSRLRGPLRRVASGVLAAGLAVGCFVAGAVVTREPSVGVLEFAAVLRAPGGAITVTAEGRRVGIGRIVHLRTDDLPILPKGEYYEIWFVGPGDSPGRPNRVSAGTFHPDAQGRSDIEVTAAVDPTKFPELSVTAEPGDGDPAPSGREVLRGPLTLRG